MCSVLERYSSMSQSHAQAAMMCGVGIKFGVDITDIIDAHNIIDYVIKVLLAHLRRTPQNINHSEN